MASYVANKFASNPGLGAQQQYAQGLRGYASNRFAGGGAPGTTSMAPHLSVAEAQRPLGEDVALAREFGYGSGLSGLDKAWRFSPQSYEKVASNALRNVPLQDLRIEKQYAGQPLVRTESGGIRYTADPVTGMPVPIVIPPRDPADSSD